MTIRVRAHFDGRVFVPDERVDLPVNQIVTVEAETRAPHAGASDIQERNEALLEFLASPSNGNGLPDQALERESIYEDRD